MDIETRMYQIRGEGGISIYEPRVLITAESRENLDPRVLNGLARSIENLIRNGIKRARMEDAK